MLRSLAAAALAFSLLPASAHADELEDVVARFAATYPELCDWALGGGPTQYEPEVFETSFLYDWEEATDEPRVFKLYRIHCYTGAYNVGHVFFSVTEDGIEPVHFAVPDFIATYLDDLSEELDTFAVTGITTQATLINSEVDPETLTITSTSYWRGVGDASSNGRWEFHEGDFRLVEYQIDPTYDGVVAPMTVIENGLSVIPE